MATLIERALQKFAAAMRRKSEAPTDKPPTPVDDHLRSIARDDPQKPTQK
jgi:hypothetical protein